VTLKLCLYFPRHIRGVEFNKAELQLYVSTFEKNVHLPAEDN
jgi:hypothetical protein